MGDRMSYTCNLCLKDFYNRTDFMRHKKRQRACISQRECEVRIGNYEQIKNKLKRLQNEMNNLQDKYETLKDVNQQDKEKIKFYENKVIAWQKKPKRGTHISFQPTDNSNNVNIENQTVNNVSNVNNVNNVYNLQLNQYVVQLTPIEKPDTSHITDDELRMWMSRDNFEESFPALLERIYFDENNPINMHWCVATKDKHDGGFLYNSDAGAVERIDTDKLVQKMFTIGLSCICQRLEDIYEAQSDHYRPIIDNYMRKKNMARQERHQQLIQDSSFRRLPKEEQRKKLLEGEEPIPKLYREYFSYWTYVDKCDGVEAITNRDEFLVSSVGLMGSRMARAFWDQHKISRPKVKNNGFNFKLPSSAIKIIKSDDITVNAQQTQ